jgi:hypothetical protein
VVGLVLADSVVIAAPQGSGVLVPDDHFVADQLIFTLTEPREPPVQGLWRPDGAGSYSFTIASAADRCSTVSPVS